MSYSLSARHFCIASLESQFSLQGRCYCPGVFEQNFFLGADQTVQ